MALVDLEFAELHSPLFFAGKNFGQKLDIHDGKNRGIKLQWDTTEKELIIHYDGCKAHMPHTSVQSRVEIGNGKKRVSPFAAENLVPKPGIKAQVSTPTDHVFAGAGQGQTGVGAKVK